MSCIYFQIRIMTEDVDLYELHISRSEEWRNMDISMSCIFPDQKNSVRWRSRWVAYFQIRRMMEDGELEELHISRCREWRKKKISMSCIFRDQKNDGRWRSRLIAYFQMQRNDGRWRFQWFAYFQIRRMSEDGYLDDSRLRWFAYFQMQKNGTIWKEVSMSCIFPDQKNDGRWKPRWVAYFQIRRMSEDGLDFDDSRISRCRRMAQYGKSS